RHATDSRRPTIPVRRPDVQEEDPPLSSVEHSSPPSTWDTTVVHHPEATEQSALQPPVFINLLSAPITTAFDHLPQDAQPPVIIDRTADGSHVPRSGDLPTSRQSDYFLGSAPAFLSERSSLTADSLNVLGATSNHTSNEEQPLTLAAGGVAGMEPEDEEALGDSPAEEPTMVKSQ
ncbi:hypothetical protein K443DRAFT_14227, partial [Laccaria amethystina LaAM-08-1]